MIRIWIIFLSSSFTVLYLFSSENEELFCGKFYKECMPTYSVYYLAYEHIADILLALALLLFAFHQDKYILFFKLFLFIQLVDFGLFTLFYKSPFPWNVAKNVILAVPLLYETWKNLQQRYHNT